MDAPIVENVPPRVTLRCEDCHSTTRVYHVPPVTEVGAYRYCPKCGSSNLSAFMSSEDNFIEALARHYNMPPKLMQQVYDLWEPHVHHRFADFVAALKEEAKADEAKVAV